MFPYWGLLKKDPKTCKRIFKVMWPAGVQGILVTLVNVVDLFVISIFLNKNAVNGAATGIALISLVIFTIYAFSAGANVYFGQFLRRDEVAKVKEIIAYKIIISYLFSIFFVTLVFAVGMDRFLSLVLTSSNYNLAATLEQGRIYFSYILLTLIFFPLDVVFYSTLTASGDTFISMIITGISAVFNFFVTFLLINPKVGNLHIMGAPIGTLLARFIEFIMLVGYLFFYKKIFWFPNWKSFIVRKSIWMKSFKAGLYLLPSEVCYPIFLILQQSIAVRLAGPDILAGINIGTMFLELGFSFLFCLYAAIPVFIGSYIGLNQPDEAISNSKKIIAITSIIFIFMGLFLFTASFWLPNLYPLAALNTTGKDALKYFLLGNSFGFGFYATAIMFFLIGKSGGIFIRSVLAEQIPFFVVYLPVLYVLLSYTSLSPYVVFAIIPASYAIQLFLGLIIYFKTNWASNNLVKKIK